MLTSIILCFGACVGSFLNVCIHRIPKDESVIRPGSRCPRCRSPLAWRDNIPLVSYILLRGRCRRCRRRISPRYPAVELLTAMLYWGLCRRWEWQAFGFLFCAAAAALVAVAFIDWDTFLIPDVLSLGLAAAGLASSPWNPLFTQGPWWRLLSGVVGAAGGFLICWGTASLGEALFEKEAMGGGDVKLLAAIGAWTGVVGAFDSLVIGSLLGSIYGIGLMLRGRIRRQDPIPFGPFLSAGAIFTFFYRLPFGWPVV